MAFPHRIIIEWSDEDEAYVAFVEALGTHGLGDTPGDALRKCIVASVTAMGVAEQEQRSEELRKKLG